MHGDATATGAHDGLESDDLVSEFERETAKRDADLDVDGLETSWFSKLRKYFDPRNK